MANLSYFYYLRMSKVASSAPKAIRRMQIQRESDLPNDASQTPGKFHPRINIYIYMTSCI